MAVVSTHNHQAEMRRMLKRSDRPLFALGFKICTGWLDHKRTAEAHRHLNLCHLCLDLINVKGSSAPLLHASVTSEETDYILASASTMFQGLIYMYEVFQLLRMTGQSHSQVAKRVEDKIKDHVLSRDIFSSYVHVDDAFVVYTPGMQQLQQVFWLHALKWVRVVIYTYLALSTVIWYPKVYFKTRCK